MNKCQGCIDDLENQMAHYGGCIPWSSSEDEDEDPIEETKPTENKKKPVVNVKEQSSKPTESSSVAT